MCRWGIKPLFRSWPIWSMLGAGVRGGGHFAVCGTFCWRVCNGQVRMIVLTFIKKGRRWIPPTHRAGARASDHSRQGILRDCQQSQLLTQLSRQRAVTGGGVATDNTNGTATSPGKKRSGTYNGMNPSGASGALKTEQKRCYCYSDHAHSPIEEKKGRDLVGCRVNVLFYNVDTRLL
jgi:hypothetical protein